MSERPEQPPPAASVVASHHPNPLPAIPGEGIRGVPLYRPNALADAPHDVIAPGGYEWWYFDAEDPATDTQIVAIYLHGFVFHPGYLRHYARFVRRPTKTQPPVPDDAACMYLVVYRGGKIVSQLMTQYPTTQYAAARDAVNVRLGPNTLTQDAAGLQLHVEANPWHLTWHGPVRHHHERLAADLTFAPRLPHPPQERHFLSRAMTGADHHWVLANPLCDVSGEVRIEPTSGGAAETIRFTGRGYHDHNYGTAPIGPGLAKWIWGRAIVGHRVVTFHYAVPRDGQLRPESHLVVADERQLDEIETLPTIQFDRHTGWGLAYPSSVRWAGVMTLTDPRVIDSTPFYMRLQYDADVGGQRTTAFCEAAYPHRLRWPILGRLAEASIDKRGV